MDTLLWYIGCTLLHLGNGVLNTKNTECMKSISIHHRDSLFICRCTVLSTVWHDVVCSQTESLQLLCCSTYFTSGLFHNNRDGLFTQENYGMIKDIRRKKALQWEMFQLCIKELQFALDLFHFSHSTDFCGPYLCITATYIHHAVA